MTIDLSPTAEVLLTRLRQEPDRVRYDIDIFGGMFRPADVDRLDAAYRELETHGLVERSGSFVRFFGEHKRLYRLSERGLLPAGTPSFREEHIVHVDFETMQPEVARSPLGFKS